jgi:hypothetical protein
MQRGNTVGRIVYPACFWRESSSNPVNTTSYVKNECTEKITREEQGGVYVGVWAQPTPPRIPILLSQLTFFQWIQRI